MSKDRKTLQLGMNPSTASNALKKSLMFSLAQKCEMDTCHQCGNLILTAKELSVEHKTPWLDSEDPVGLFFDLGNIAFSHLSCNVAAGRKTGPVYTETERKERARTHRLKWNKKVTSDGVTNRQAAYIKHGH